MNISEISAIGGKLSTLIPKAKRDRTRLSTVMMTSGEKKKHSLGVSTKWRRKLNTHTTN